MGNGFLSWTERKGLILDVEVTLNNRPLSYMEDDVWLPVLTPNSLHDPVCYLRRNLIIWTTRICASGQDILSAAKRKFGSVWRGSMWTSLPEESRKARPSWERWGRFDQVGRHEYRKVEVWHRQGYYWRSRWCGSCFKVGTSCLERAVEHPLPLELKEVVKQ